MVMSGSVFCPVHGPCGINIFLHRGIYGLAICVFLILSRLVSFIEEGYRLSWV